MASFLFSLIAVALSVTSVVAAPFKRNPFAFLQKTRSDSAIFQLGNITYLANTKYPKATLSAGRGPRNDVSDVPLTVLYTNASVVTRDILESTIASYLETDDVFSQDFLAGLLLSSTAPGKASVDASATSYIQSLGIEHVVYSSAFSKVGGHGAPSAAYVDISVSPNLPPGPYLASFSGGSIALSTVYRLYEDTYRDFLYGSYDLNDGNGTHAYLDYSFPSFGYPAIPIPSRLYSLTDTRAMAGDRVAIKDLYDIKGLKTTGGSRAWEYITSPASANAPSIQRIADQGGVLVGKFKLAQFASGANPWDWQDEHYPFNPRGDGWLTCSASSSGGGCSIAAYDWLDFAIGSDTGSSMRRPAAVSGTYGQRPSQGLMSLEGVMPLGGATDTAGVFCRDPVKWSRFSKAWYTPSLFQSPNITGLSALDVPDNQGYPKTILYPTDYLPLNNSAAQVILQNFISNLTTVFGMTVKEFNFTATVQAAPDPAVNNLTYLSNGPLGVINAYTQWEAVGKPLITAWKSLFNGAFPPIDSARRPGWRRYNQTANTAAAYTAAQAAKKLAVDWYEENLQYSTPESCSESLMLFDIGTSGFPSYRELNLNGFPNTSFLATTPKGAAVSVANICPIYGCADYVVPIGEVPYFSNVTFITEMVPVTIDMVVKRGCDFVLLNMIERLAELGVLKTVKTGKTAF
ncbi:hypothetical protein LTR95_001176 [Oleoguttula sp. CCFEE 5521]